MDVPEAVFHLDGDRAVPTELARGPWSPHAQHGGAPAALLAREAERLDPGPADFVARMTIELLRPVPLAPLTIRSRTMRPGKRVQWLELALLTEDEVEVVRANVLRLRRDDDLALPVAEPAPLSLPPPDSSTKFKIRFEEQGEVGFWRAMEVRQARGSWMEAGDAAVWFRLRVPIVAGEEPSQLQRAAAAADFGNGVSAALEPGRYLFINADLTIALHRLPVGEWVGLDASTHAEVNGVALAESVLVDERGRIGRALQSLLVDRL